MIGINDVWRAFDGHPEAAVPLGEFERTLRSLLRTAVDTTGCRLILADPYLVEPDRDEPQRVASDRYAAVVSGLAAEFGAAHVATQRAFDEALAVSSPVDWAGDRIHPGLPGHAVIAEAFLRTIGT
jgi:lysophospholipase L1-like esterase